MISNIEDFENFFIKIFGDIDRATLSSTKNYKLKLELGGENTGIKRIGQALGRSKSILGYCLKEREVWCRILLWSEQEEMLLKAAGLNLKSADIIFSRKGDEDVLYLHFKKYLESLTLPIAKSIINYEMAEEPSANITCYFINFEIPLIINIYDDRGVDLFSPRKKIIEDIEQKFSDWILK